MSTSPFCWWGILDGVYIPEFLLSYKGIGPSAKLCFARIAKYAGTNEVCWPSQESLARDLGVSVRTVGTYISELERDGFLEVIQKGMGQSNHYRPLRHRLINDHFCGSTSDQDRNVPSDQDTKTSSGPSIELKEINNQGNQTAIQQEEVTVSDQKLSRWDIERELSSRGIKFGTAFKKFIRENLTDEIALMPVADAADLLHADFKRRGGRIRSSAPERENFVRRESSAMSAVPVTALAIVNDWRKDALFGTYLFDLAKTGKRVAPDQAREAYLIWERLTEAQKIGAIEDIKYLVANASESKFVPGPVKHLNGEPWDALRLPAPPKKTDKQTRALEIAYERQARRDRGEIVL
jgi:hypothetical protein